MEIKCFVGKWFLPWTMCDQVGIDRVYAYGAFAVIAPCSAESGDVEEIIDRNVGLGRETAHVLASHLKPVEDIPKALRNHSVGVYACRDRDDKGNPFDDPNTEVVQIIPFFSR